MKQATRVTAEAPIPNKKSPIKFKGKKNRPWDRIPGDVLCRILEQLAPDMRSNYQSRLVCKQWNSCWELHNWVPVWLKQGVWMYILCLAQEELSTHQEYWSPQNGSLFHIPRPGHHNFQNSSQGLLVGHISHEFLVIHNPLAAAPRAKLVPCDFEPQQPQLLVEDAARGIYKVGMVTGDATHVYSSVTGEWETFRTAGEFLSNDDVFKACLLASRAAGSGDRNPFTSPGTYMMQFHMDTKNLSCAEEQQEQRTAWKVRRNDRRYGRPSDVQPPCGVRVFHAAPGRCVSLVLKSHYPAEEPFMEALVYELVETEDGESLTWRRLGSTQLLRGVDWSRYPGIESIKYITSSCAENLLCLQLCYPYNNNLRERYTIRECRVMEPVLFDLDNRSWTNLSDIKDELSRNIIHIFKPNPLARHTFE